MAVYSLAQVANARCDKCGSVDSILSPCEVCKCELCFDCKEEKNHHHNLPEVVSIPEEVTNGLKTKTLPCSLEGTVYSLCVTHASKEPYLWLYTYQNLCKMNIQGHKIITFDIDCSDMSKYARSIDAMTNGKVLLSLKESILCVNKKNSLSTFIDFKIHNANVYGIHIAGDNSVLVCLQGGKIGIAYLSKKGKFLKFISTEEEVPLRIQELSDRTLLILSSRSLKFYWQTSFRFSENVLDWKSGRGIDMCLTKHERILIGIEQSNEILVLTQSGSIENEVRLGETSFESEIQCMYIDAADRLWAYVCSGEIVVIEEVSKLIREHPRILESTQL
ncbi:uncharacterized protein LOC134279939 [Saccostrea cucullata]|uniref:uncharacterized protein LOC134279939 n=1 Tax=Saccostrea cuccullata TaxID=36930 RepID=UPI002ED3FFB4